MNKIKEYAPPGYDLNREIGLFFIAGTVTLILLPIGRFYELLANIEMYRDLAGNLPAAGSLLFDAFKFAGYYAIMVIFTLSDHYQYITKTTKCIYTLKRTGNKYEVIKRCLTIPAVACIIGIVIVVILCLVFKGSYAKKIQELTVYMNLWRMMVC